MGSIWLDVFSRSQEDDPTEGTGDTKSQESFRIIQPSELIIPPRTSTVATFLHDTDEIYNERFH